jgi:GABA permease
MRNPIRNESDAFYIVVGSSALIAGAAVLGAIVDPLVGLALVAGAVIGALLWELATKDPQRRRPLRDAASETRRNAPDANPRVLVVANRTLHGDELRAILRRRAADGAELHVVAPILTSRTHYLASDVDKELDEARERLATALAWARAEGVTASGKVGDANVALGAIEDELRLFGADEVIISTYPPGASNWLETGIVERLRDELDIPVTHVVVEPDRASGAP